MRKTIFMPALAVVAISAASTAMSPAAAMATTDPSASAVVWADFQQPAAWDNQADNLHWYVETPVVTHQMVGRVATTVVTSATAIDCSSFNTGYSTNDTWTSVSFKTVACSDTSATITYKVTKAMVGDRVSVIGWTSTPQTTATVSGKVTVGKTTTTDSATAQRADAVKPIGDLVALGTYNGQQVSIASAGGANEIWVGSTRYSAPDGQVAHVSLDGSTVNLWIQNTSSMDQWKLDLTTGAVSTQSIAMVSLVSMGTPGFTVDTGAPITYGTQKEVYSWAGDKFFGFGVYGESVAGYTDTAVVVHGYYRIEYVEVMDVDGTMWGTGGAPSPGLPLTITNIGADRVDYQVPDGKGGTLSCTITKAAGNVCVQG